MERCHEGRRHFGNTLAKTDNLRDDITVLPSGFGTKVKKIYQDETEVDEAFAPQSVTITLEDEIDISRGDMLVKENNPPKQGQDIEAMICWFSNKSLTQRGKFIIRHTTKETKAIVEKISYKVDVNTLRKVEDVSDFSLNEIGRVSLRTAAPLFYDSYNKNRQTGSFILVDPGTNETVAAGMII
ncbi:hypothetical protein N9986_03960 [Akkermansiaceae bacterium]|nr:hypothetical protein [Akkermansiaceae bacterium]